MLISWKNKLENYLNEHTFSDGSHDLAHFQRVWKIAEKLSDEKDDKLVIMAASYLHDIVSYPKNDPRWSQSSIHAANKAEKILNELDFPEDKIESVKHCIEAHSFSAGVVPLTNEAKIVQDADRMESLGAIGLSRVFYVAGQLGTKLFDSEDPFAEGRPLDDKKYAVDHFEQKLLKLQETIQTEKGKKEAGRRSKILLRFLEDLKEELSL